MGTHPYCFGDKLFLQQEGGPIGMRFTASLANLEMKMWDRAWTNLMVRENLHYLMFLRYVDDVQLVLPIISKGWFWNGKDFAYSTDQEKADAEADVSDEHRTTIQITKVMCSLVEFLQFTGEVTDFGYCNMGGKW